MFFVPQLGDQQCFSRIDCSSGRRDFPHIGHSSLHHIQRYHLQKLVYTWQGLPSLNFPWFVHQVQHPYWYTSVVKVSNNFPYQQLWNCLFNRLYNTTTVFWGTVMYLASNYGLCFWRNYDGAFCYNTTTCFIFSSQLSSIVSPSMESTPLSMSN